MGADGTPDLTPDLTLPRVASTFRAVSRATSVLLVLLGALVLLGWAWNVDIFKRGVPGLTAMNPMTAIGFVLFGISLTILSRPTPPLLRRVGFVLAAVPALIGAARLLAFGGIWDLELDQLFFRDQLVRSDFGRANRIAPNTALNFVLLGAALLLIDRPIGRFRWPAQLLAVSAAMTALLALIGYAYGLPWFYGIGANIPMALPTAAAFLVAATGVLCARPTHGIMTVISSDSSGGAMIRRLLPAVLIVPAALGGLRLAGQRAMLFDPDLGQWLLVVVIMTVLVVLVGWIAHLLFRADIERARTERLLAHQAKYDALTDLPNRRLFAERLSEELERGRQQGTLTSVLFVDLDRFKIINDSLGHLVGDELLVAAGKRIERCLGERDTVARLGGDEFTVLVVDLDTRDRALELADRIRQAFNQPFTIGPHDVVTTVSIGMAFAEAGEEDLIRHADIAMYRAKTRGRARCEVFHPAMDLAARERLRLENGLRRALARGELRVYYQPEIEIDTGCLVGMEALVRWQHPERGLISPSEFLPIAEETGLIVPIGRWVLFEACRQAVAWQTQYRRDLALMVSVNLSGKHLQQATLVDDVREVLESTRIDPAHLILEITETVAMAGAETTIEILRRLKSLGVQLAIDDFGTGFSSLAYLKRFPVDLLKIDKTFVDGVARRGHDTAIVEAIIALGHALGLRVIAEGVETPDQLQELRALGSELGQGYFFAGPLSDDVENGIPPLLDEQRRWTATSSFQ